MSESSFPVIFDVPAGSTVTVTGPDGKVLVVYTTQVDVPSGSKVSVKAK